PQLLLDKCLDAEPQNRPSAKELTNALHQFYDDLKNKKKLNYINKLEKLKTHAKASQYMIKLNRHDSTIR
ncbi:12965_t:CDS:1, partial [Cetraspora pellucida]